MPELPVVSGREVVRALQRAGFVVNRQRSSHVILRHAEQRLTLSVPVHAGEDMPSGTLRSILRKAGLSVEEFRRLLR